MLKRLLIALAVLALASFALAACGDSDDSSTTAAVTPSSSTTGDDATTDDDAAAEEDSDDDGDVPAATGDGGDATVSIAADPSGALAFTKTELTTTAGSDTIDFDNESSTGHNVEIEDQDGNVVAETDTITGSKTSAVADLKAGTYTFFCDIPGHREAGMEGTLEVK